MPRPLPPEGHLNLKDAIQFLDNHGLHISEGMVYKYVKQGRLLRHGPESRKQKYYKIQELEKLVREEKGKLTEETDVQFSPATIGDLEKITLVSEKLFKTATLRPIQTPTRTEWFEKEPKGHYVVRKSNGDVVAYLHIVALTDERIEAYMRNEFRGRDITGEMVQKLEPGKPTGCIIVSIGSDPSIKRSLRRRHTGILLRGVSKELEQLGKQGIIIPRLYAYTESKSGILLSVRMHMRQYSEPVRRRYTYWLDILNSSVPLLKAYQRALGELFLKHSEYAVSLNNWQQHRHPGD